MLEPEFNAKIIRMILVEPEKSIEDTRESLTTEIKDLKTSQARKNAITEMWNWLVVMSTRMEEAEEWISDIEDKIMENNEAEKKKERKILDHECRLRKLSNSLKHNKIHIIEVPE